MALKKIMISATVATLCVSSLGAYELKPMGFKAVGMGGAGVASSRGSLATYYNPALIGISDYTAEFSLNVGVGIRENKLIDTADQLNNLNFSESLSSIKNITSTNYESMDQPQQDALDKIEQAVEILNKIPKGNGVEFSPNVSFAAQMSNYFAMGAYVSAEVRASMDIASDENGNKKLGLIFETEGGYIEYNNGTISTSDQISYETLSLQGTIDGGETAINVNTLTMAEVPVSFAYPIEQRRGTWSFGVSAKAMQVETFSKRVAIDSESDDITEDYENNKKTYTALGIDLGMLYKEHQTGLTLALVGKNVNNPSFETEPDSNGKIEKFKFEPFLRAGMSLPIWNDNIELAIDADLQESDTNYEGMKSRYVGGGMEFHPASWFALRVGAMKNVAPVSINEGLIATAGLGFGLKWLQFDLSAQASSEKGTFDGNEIPKYMNLNFSLVSKWGDGYNRKVPQTNDESTNSTVVEDQQLSPEEEQKTKEKADSAFEELDNSI